MRRARGWPGQRACKGSGSACSTLPSRREIFLDRIEQRLSERGLEVIRYAKPTNTRPAPTPLYQQIADEVDVVIEALSD